MSGFTLLTNEQECQTVLQCTPHILPEDGIAIVQSTNVCQTEITIDCKDNDADLQKILGFLPTERIAKEAARQIQPSRKIRIKFILPRKSKGRTSHQETETVTETEPEIVAETDSAEDEEFSIHSKLSLSDPSSGYKLSEEIAKTIPILKKTVGRTFPTESIECQTILFVYPHFLEGNESGTVTAETSMQTAVTFTPRSSLSNIIPKLKSYLHHDGRVIDCGDCFKSDNVIDFIRELLGDIVSMHENLFDPDYVPPEIPKDLTLDLNKSTNTEINSNTAATNTSRQTSAQSLKGSKLPDPGIPEIKPDLIIRRDRDNYLEPVTRPACDCCKFSPCCSDLEINVTVDRQPFDKCCSTKNEDLQVAIYSPQQPVDSIVNVLIDKVTNKDKKLPPNMEKRLVPVGNIDYSQQFDSTKNEETQIVLYTPLPPDDAIIKNRFDQTLSKDTKLPPNTEKQLVLAGNIDYSQQYDTYLRSDRPSLEKAIEYPSGFEEIVKEKLKNIDPFKFCSEKGIQCDCIKYETPTESSPRKKLLALPSTSPEPALENGQKISSISADTELGKELALRTKYYESLLENEVPLRTVNFEPVVKNQLALPSQSEDVKNVRKKMHLCKCFKGKTTIGCLYCTKNIDADVTICTAQKAPEINNPYLSIEDKSIQKKNQEPIEYKTQKDEELKMSPIDISLTIHESSLLEMYNQPPDISLPLYSEKTLVESKQDPLIKPSKTVTILDETISQNTIPLKRTHENKDLASSPPSKQTLENTDLAPSPLQNTTPLKQTHENKDLVYSSPQNSCCMETYMEELSFQSPDTDDETDDDYTTATSSPTRKPEEVDENDPERKASREEMMKLLVDLKIIDSSQNLQVVDCKKRKQKKSVRSITTSIVSTKTICMNSERNKNFLNLFKMTDTCSAMSSAKSLECEPQCSQIITIITQGLTNNYPSTPALHFPKDCAALLTPKKSCLSSQQSAATNNVQFSLLKDDEDNLQKKYRRCHPSCSEHIIATKCLDCVKGKNNATADICACRNLRKSPLKPCAATGIPPPPSKTVSLNSKASSKTPSVQERVISAVKCCESQLQPLRDAFTDLKQKLKELNIPEVNCIFETDAFDLLKSKSSKKFRIRVATNPDPSKCGFHTTSTKIKFVPPAGCSSSYSNINSCPSRISSQSCRSDRTAIDYSPNNSAFVAPRCQSVPQNWKRYYSCLLHYDQNAPCLRRPTSTQNNFSNRNRTHDKGFQTSNSSSYCSLNTACMEDNFDCSTNASLSNFSHVSSEEVQECRCSHNNYNYMNGGPRYYN